MIRDAMERREAHATTGPRMYVRFFGGWAFDEADVLRRDLAQVGHSKGVPMGSDLRPGTGSPSSLIYALRDTQEANLDRIQVVKGWMDEAGAPRKRIVDVSASGRRVVGANRGHPPVGNILDVTTATFTDDIGAPELIGYWTDDDSDPSQPAFYYVRVFEIPTHRWTTCDAVPNGLPILGRVPATIQERTSTSSIWYNPDSAE